MRTTVAGWALSLGVATLLLGCASGPSTRSEDGQVGGPPIDWESPLHGGITVRSPAAAQRRVDFRLLVPRFARPDLIQVDAQDGLRMKERTVAFVYHLADQGTVLVQERHPGDHDVAWMRDRADDLHAPSEAFRMVTVRNLPGLLVSSGGIGRIIWIEGGVLFDITGPAVAPDQVLQLAERL